MKESLGTSLVFNLMMIFVAVIIVILVGSISYSKAFKIRNRIIDRIEEYNGYEINNGSIEAIESDLKSIGYRIVDKVSCKARDEGQLLTNEYGGQYNYCVYKYKTSKGYYYGVTVFINFDIPLIGRYINIPVYGETRVVLIKNEVEN